MVFHLRMPILITVSLGVAGGCGASNRQRDRVVISATLQL